jgi:hypothetical protein
MHELRMKRLLGTAAVLVGLAYACGGTGGPSAAGAGGSGTAGASGSGEPGESGGSSGSGGSAVTGGSAGSTPIIPVDAGGDADVTVDPDAACGIGSAEATLRPVSMFVTFDRSTSMVRAEPDPVTLLNRWETAALALTEFFSSPAADGLGVALRFFPDDRPEVGCTQEECNVAACTEPLVPMDTLSAAVAPDDAHEAALILAVEEATPMLPMNGEMAKGGTPISVALEGAAAWTASHQQDHPDQKTVILFVTDGDPAGCDERPAFIQGIAQTALAEHDVSTYVVGLTDALGEGVNQDNLNELAAAGGTEQAFFIKDGPTAAEDLFDALDAVRGLALPCDFPLPESTKEGTEIDPGFVNVVYTAGDGTERTLTKLSEGTTCADSQSWHYDNEDTPSRIVLCPSACDVISADGSAKLQILAGCLTIIEPPR